MKTWLHRLLVALLLVTSLGLVSCASSDSNTGVPPAILTANPSDRTLLEVGTNRLVTGEPHSAKVEIVVSRIAPSQGESANDVWSGDEFSTTTFRENRVTALTVELDGHKLKLSRSMVAPLVAPNAMSLTRSKGDRTYLLISGLDGCASYRAVFTFEKGLLCQRLMALGEFPNEVWERTIYHNDFLEHPERHKNM